MPLIVLWHGDSVLFNAPYYADAWFYLGYFRNLIEFKRDLFNGSYYGSRLSWLLPGFVIHSLFPSVVANWILHLAVQSLATFSLFSILRAVAGIRSAFLGTLVFAVYPWLWVATGWDYPDGVGIAYCLLATSLLTMSALNTERRWTLFAAGLALAAMMYSHIFLGSFTPILALGYLALTRLGRQVPFLVAVRSFTVWVGAGFAGLTLALCGINYVLDGQFWFYAPSVERAVSMARDFHFTRSIWSDHQLVPWLWPSAIGFLIALLVVLWCVKHRSWRDDGPGLFFALQLLLIICYTAYLQSRGTTVLGHYPYASYLLPFVFLVMGVSLWPAARTMNSRTYAAICALAVLAFAALWYNPQGSLFHAQPVAQLATTVLGACALVAAFFLREKVLGSILAIAGFVAITAVSTAQTAYLNGLNLHGSRLQYERIMGARQHVEERRGHSPVLFWYDKREPDFHDYFALNASYLAEFSRISETFPQGCEQPLDPRTLIVVLSQTSNAAALAGDALNKCQTPFGVQSRIDSVRQIEGSRGPYTLTTLRLEAIGASEQPSGDLFKGIPLERLQRGDPKASLEQTPEGWRIETLPSQGAFAAKASLGLDPTLPRRLAVHVRIRVLDGKVGVGILDSSGKTFLMERPVWPLAQFIDVVLPLPSPPAIGDLVVCNLDSHNLSSTALIGKIEVRTTP